MKWFRFYHDAIDDPKVQRLPGESFKFWVNVLCLASQSDERGIVNLGIGDISFATRVSDADAETMMTDLIRRGLVEETVEGYAIHNWNGRQFKSDNVTDRVGKFRSKEKSPDETLHETLQATPNATLKPSVSTDSQIADTELGDKSPTPPKRTRATAPKYSAEFEEFWRDYPSGHGSKKETWEQWQRLVTDNETREAVHTGLAAWKQSDRWQRGYIKDAQRWLKGRQWEDAVPMEATSATKTQPQGAPVSSKWDAAFAEVGRRRGWPTDDDTPDDVIDTTGRISA